MIVDNKSRDDGLTSKSRLLRPADDLVASTSTSERKLSVELPTPRQIYTVGSIVSGIVHLGTLERELIQEVQVSLVCVIRSMHHRYYGGTSHDVRRETTNLVHRDQTLWSRQNGDESSPPADFAFQIAIPDFGNDNKVNNPITPLPPSFHAGKRRGWKNMMTYGTPIGFVKYHIKASVIRKGALKRKERAFSPFLFLPPSPPPPLLPTPPEIISEQDLHHLNDLWDSDSASTNMRHAAFNSNGGQATLALWLPRVPSFPRLTRIPFLLCLTLQTRRVRGTSDPQPSGDVLPPATQLDRASMYLRQSIRSCARGGIQHHLTTYDKAPTDNMLHGITPQEGAWTLYKYGSEAYWEKGYIWRGLWMFKEATNFVNRQLAWKYDLVAEIPIKGFGNSAKLVSRDLEINSGVTAGTNVPTASEDSEDMLELPPDYFDIEGTNEEEEEEEGSDRDEKALY